MQSKQQVADQQRVQLAKAAQRLRGLMRERAKVANTTEHAETLIKWAKDPQYTPLGQFARLVKAATQYYQIVGSDRRSIGLICYRSELKYIKPGSRWLVVIIG